MNSRKGDGIKSLVCIFEDTTICLIAFSNLEKMIVNIKKILLILCKELQCSF